VRTGGGARPDLVGKRARPTTCSHHGHRVVLPWADAEVVTAADHNLGERTAGVPRQIVVRPEQPDVATTDPLREDHDVAHVGIGHRPVAGEDTEVVGCGQPHSHPVLDLGVVRTVSDRERAVDSVNAWVLDAARLHVDHRGGVDIVAIAVGGGSGNQGGAFGDPPVADTVGAARQPKHTQAAPQVGTE